jgi:preprotein translocase subunit YajC
MNTILLQATGGFDPKMLIMMGLIFVVMYFFIIRPQRKKEKDLTKLREALKKNDDIVTAGGIHGKVMDVDGDTVVIAIESAAKIRVDKSSVAIINGVAGAAKKK